MAIGPPTGLTREWKRSWLRLGSVLELDLGAAIRTKCVPTATFDKVRADRGALAGLYLRANQILEGEADLMTPSID